LIRDWYGEQLRDFSAAQEYAQRLSAQFSGIAGSNVLNSSLDIADERGTVLSVLPLGQWHQRRVRRL
jgi:hypothetical protein